MQETKNKTLGGRLWLVFILIGLAGQFAWSIENMYLNTYITYLNFTDPSGAGFNYSLMIAITTALSAIVATLTTIVIGSLIDKVGHRKWFISIGYIIWGITTACFGLLNVNSSSELIPIKMAASTAAILVIVLDCVMTFFGSTSNDASFNSYVTSKTDDENRGKVEGVLSILPLIAMLIVFVGLNGLTTKESGYRWDLFFYIVGGIVLLVGVVAIFLIPNEKETIKDKSILKLMVTGFKPTTVKKNPLLYWVLLIYFIYSVACQVYFPYLMVYIERTCAISNSGTSFLSSFAIVMAVALLGGSLLSLIVGFLADKFGKDKMIIPSIAILMAGLLLMYFIPSIGSGNTRTGYAAFSCLIMIFGYVAIPTVINALVRQYIPKGEEGTFMGVRMIFVVALPMCIGPFIGDAFNQAYGQTYKSEYNVTSVTPSKFGYLMALAILALALIPTFFYLNSVKKGNTSNEEKQPK